MLTPEEIILLELHQFNIKFNYLPDYKKAHNELLNWIRNKLDNNIPIKKIKKQLLDKLKEMYHLVNLDINIVALEMLELLEVPKSIYVADNITMLGLSLDELIISRVNTHFRDLLKQYQSQNIEVNKTKRKELNSTVRMSNDYIKVVKDSGIAYLEKKESRKIKGWLYSAILDRRTSKLCTSLNGKFYSKKIYPTRQDLPYIPLVSTHPNCRSVLLTVLDQDNLKEFKEKYNVSLEYFLKNNKYEAIKIIGKDRYNLFINNNLKAEDIFNYKERRYYTVKEIKDMLKKG